MFRFSLLFISLFLFAGCASQQQLPNNSVNVNESKLTLGTAQKEIKKGMSQADVVTILGAPNMVTKDKNDIETWVYDRASNEVVVTTGTAGSMGLILTPMSGTLLGATASHGQMSTSQKTLTLILKFEDGVLSTFTYNYTSF